MNQKEKLFNIHTNFCFRQRLYWMSHSLWDLILFGVDFINCTFGNCLLWDSRWFFYQTFCRVYSIFLKNETIGKLLRIGRGLSCVVRNKYTESVKKKTRGDMEGEIKMVSNICCVKKSEVWRILLSGAGEKKISFLWRKQEVQMDTNILFSSFFLIMKSGRGRLGRSDR